MTWQEYSVALPALPADVTGEQWRAAVAQGEALLEQVTAEDKPMARAVLGSTLIESGALLGFVSPVDFELDKA